MKRRHNAKFWLLMTALGFVGGAALVGFQLSGLNADKAHIGQLIAQTQDESAVQSQLAKSQQDLDAAKSQLTHLEQGIPGTAYVPTMLQELAKVGNASGISVTGIRPVPTTANTAAAQSTDAQTVQKPAYNALDIEVKGRGNYAAVMKFITALQTFPKIVGSRTISITPCLEPSDAAQGLVDITIGLRAYLFADSGKSGAQQVSKPADTKGKGATA
jgi:Tfp pilus assembly protein PilO